MKIAQFVHLITYNKLMGGFLHTPFKIDFLTKNGQKNIFFLNTFGKNSTFFPKHKKFKKLPLTT